MYLSMAHTICSDTSCKSQVINFTTNLLKTIWAIYKLDTLCYTCPKVSALRRFSDGNQG